MTVKELSARMDVRELVQWGEWIRQRDEPVEPAQQQRQMRRGGG